MENVTVPFNAHAAAMTSGEDEKGEQEAFCHTNHTGKDMNGGAVIYGSDEYCGKHGLCIKWATRVTASRGGRCPVHETAVRRALRAARDVQQGEKVPVRKDYYGYFCAKYRAERRALRNEDDLAGVTPDERKLVTAGQRVRRVSKA